MKRSLERIAIITRSTRLEALQRTKATVGAAKFVLSQNAQARSRNREAKLGIAAEEAVAFEVADAAADFADYEDEDRKWRTTLQQLRRDLELGYPLALVERDHLPNFDFGRCVLAVAVGPDGLVANAAKYVGDTPLIGINPDPQRNDGLLVPFSVSEARDAAQAVLRGRAKMDSVALAEAITNDGQRMLAFNDFFIGRQGHASARYTVSVGAMAEPQSSSGVLVSTGAGSTGWFSSVINMVNRLAPVLGGTHHPIPPIALPRNDRRLLWAVREPFISKHSQANLVGGILHENECLVLESIMPDQGVVFSDGVENDYIEFNSGTIVEVGVSAKRASLVTR